ncbi:MAG: response regulator transcription factor [Geitlerinemataceae cyanobacterium]
MNPFCIQIVEGNPQLRSLLGWHLQQTGYKVCQAAGLRQSRDLFLQHSPKLLLIDVELPDGNGLELCRWLMQYDCSVAIVSARSTEADVVAGLRAGADDYIRKPFGMQELLARVEALLRRQKAPAPVARLSYGPLEIDLVQRRVKLQDELIELTPQEFSLLYVLAQSEGTPLTRAELLKRAWPDEIDNPRTIDTHVLSLRKKIEIDPRQPTFVQTVRNVGYCFNVPLVPPLPEAVGEPARMLEAPVQVMS